MVGERNAKILWHIFMPSMLPPSLGMDTDVGSHHCAANCVTCREHLVTPRADSADAHCLIKCFGVLKVSKCFTVVQSMHSNGILAIPVVWPNRLTG